MVVTQAHMPGRELAALLLVFPTGLFSRHFTLSRKTCPNAISEFGVTPRGMFTADDGVRVQTSSSIQKKPSSYPQQWLGTFQRSEKTSTHQEGPVP